jgi:hypothetical protein
MGACLIGFICRWDYKEFTDKDVEDYFNVVKLDEDFEPKNYVNVIQKGV